MKLVLELASSLYQCCVYLEFRTLVFSVRSSIINSSLDKVQKWTKKVISCHNVPHSLIVMFIAGDEFAMHEETYSSTCGERHCLAILSLI